MVSTPICAAGMQDSRGLAVAYATLDGRIF